MYCNIVLLNKVLIDGYYNTRFGFAIVHCTKFGVTITQLVLGYVLGFLTGRKGGTLHQPPLSCYQTLQTPWLQGGASHC